MNKQLATRLTTLALLLCAATPAAAAERCATSQLECGVDACCGSNQVCCSETGVCCGLGASYCCPDGSCAASPSGCNSIDTPKCPGFEVACGGLCLAPGSDCCSDDGNHCQPTETCHDTRTCSASGNLHPALSKNESAGRTTKRLTPASDPADLERTCTVMRVGGSGQAPWTWLTCVALYGWGRARRRRR